MARKDEMSLDDELTAAFLSEEGNNEVAEEGLVESAESAPVEEEVYTEETTEDNWEDETENLPGQLAVDVYETADKLIIKARTAGIERKDLDVSISDNILTISGVLAAAKTIVLLSGTSRNATGANSAAPSHFLFQSSKTASKLFSKMVFSLFPSRRKRLKNQSAS